MIMPHSLHTFASAPQNISRQILTIVAPRIQTYQALLYDIFLEMVP